MFLLLEYIKINLFRLNIMKNNLQLKLLQFATYLTIFLWITSGLIIIGSIYLSRIGFVINLLVGTLFILLGLYFYFKEKFLSEFLKKTCESELGKLYKKVILGEVIFIMVTLLVGVIILSAVSSRVFGEGFAVFG